LSATRPNDRSVPGCNFPGEPFVVEQIGRRLAFLTDNNGNMIERSAPKEGANDC